MWSMKLAMQIFCRLGVLVLFCIVITDTATGEAGKPIIAHLFATPQNYDKKVVTIYGLVIEAQRDGSTFLLQDVSQLPLTVVRTDGVTTIVGDQLLVKGVFHASAKAPRLDAINIVKTKVLGGGGCC